MKKNFLKSLSLGVASLSLIASCSMIKGDCKGKCHEKNKCSSKSDEANKCSAAKEEVKETHKCATNSCAAKAKKAKK